MKERLGNSWITVERWKIFNHCALLRREGKLSQTTACRLGQQVKARLAADHLLRTQNTTLNTAEAWRHLKGWYHLAEDQAPKACPEMLARQTAERVELYTVVPPTEVGTAHQCHPNSHS